MEGAKPVQCLEELAVLHRVENDINTTGECRINACSQGVVTDCRSR